MASQKHHWKEALPGEYLGAYSLNGQDMVVTIQKAAKEIITGANGKKEECLVLHFAEQIMDMVCNRTNAKTITKVLGTPFLEDWGGKKIQLYPTTTRFGGEIVECIRVRDKAPKQAGAGVTRGRRRGGTSSQGRWYTSMVAPSLLGGGAMGGSSSAAAHWPLGRPRPRAWPGAFPTQAPPLRPHSGSTFLSPHLAKLVSG